MVRFLAAALILIATSARADQTPSFEAALGALRQSVLATGAKQVQARSDSLAGRIGALGQNADRLAWDASRYHNDLRDIRWRAQRSRQN